MQPIRVACWNAHNLRTKLSIIPSLTQRLDLDFLFISETWMLQQHYLGMQCYIGEALPIDSNATPNRFHYGVALFSSLSVARYDVYYITPTMIQ